MKKTYVTPVSEVVKLNVNGSIAEEAIGIGSKYVDSSEIEAKGTGFGNDDDWWSNSVNDYTNMWLEKGED